jgi:hypothetical protein
LQVSTREWEEKLQKITALSGILYFSDFCLVFVFSCFWFVVFCFCRFRFFYWSFCLFRFLGVVFMRGETVGILCILIDVETSKEYAFIYLQPRIPIGDLECAEIPSGTVCFVLLPIQTPFYTF